MYERAGNGFTYAVGPTTTTSVTWIGRKMHVRAYNTPWPNPRCPEHDWNFTRTPTCSVCLMCKWTFEDRHIPSLPPPRVAVPVVPKTKRDRLFRDAVNDPLQDTLDRFAGFSLD